MKILKIALFVALTLPGFMMIPKDVSTARAAPFPTAAHQMQFVEQDVILVRKGGKGHKMKIRKMGRGGYYAPGRYSNRGRHLGWQQGRHRGWQKQGRGW